MRTAFREFIRRLSESDEERLADEVRVWADTIPSTARVTDCRDRSRVKVAGLVRRITIRPVEGLEALEAVLWDGTGEVTAVWLGRRSIPGLALGSRIVIEGVLGRERGRPRIVNPTFEFA
ncbi:MAG TPA: OB-fold nucleic acid binding domain-containing protein [Actinomycetota bacterium]|nr:OB-fold nucleic acid binding domain-containing protein [Actinomycetota bacterium]